METSACRQDLERMERACNESALVVRDGVMERRLEFQPGYDHRSFGCGHGRHGMTLRFILALPGGTVQWAANMVNWIPGNVDVIGAIPPAGPWSLVPANMPTADAMATDLGYHSPTPRYDGQPAMNCHLLPDGACYYDGSGLNAVPVMEAFLLHGPTAVWAALARYHQDVFGSRIELTAGGPC